MVMRVLAPANELAAVEMPSRVVERKKDEPLSCEWCSLPARRYARFGGRGTETTQDVLDLCDDCAGKLATTIRRALRHGRRSR